MASSERRLATGLIRWRSPRCRLRLANAKDRSGTDEPPNKKPPACTKGFVQFATQILSADRDTGLQIRRTNNRQRRLGHDQFDPQGIPAPEIRRRVRLAQRVHAWLFRSGGCFGETRQLK